MLVQFIPIFMYAVYLSQYLSGTRPNLLLLLIFSFVMMIYVIYKLWRTLTLKSNLWLGLDCEMAVAQELNQLMLEGYNVYHDFPAEGFNIDHIVIGPKGVFAVETKGRSKPDKKGGTEEATVTYDGEKLTFPGWSEKEPLDQAIRQAKWLSQWMNSAVGEPVSVSPVLVLPGWFIDRKKTADVFIFNGKNPGMMLKWKNDTSLSETLIKRIDHQLDQRCRNIEPVGQEAGFALLHLLTRSNHIKKP